MTPPPEAQYGSTSFAEIGFCLLPGAVTGAVLSELIACVEALPAMRPESKRAGVRNLLVRLPAVARLSTSAPIMRLLHDLGLPNAFPVRGIFFDKHPGANWKVPWHQDTTITVREKRPHAGFEAWSEKEGLPHVRPPREILERMITLRLHLDNCGPENGALKVVPGSHRYGVLAAHEIQARRDQSPEFVCAVGQGAIVAMRPLLLHSSSPASHPQHRRVLHLEFANAELPHGLQWYETAGEAGF